MQNKHRPPLLKSTNMCDVLAIIHIVLPIEPLKMSDEMRTTFRMSQTIRKQQNSLIAANQDKDSGTGSTTSEVPSPGSIPVGAGPDQAVSDDGDADADADGDADGDVDGDVDADTDAHSNTSDKPFNSAASAPSSAESTEHESKQVPRISVLPTKSENLLDFDRISTSVPRKRLKREKAPRSLSIPTQIRGVSPLINSAPIRTYYSNPYSVPAMPARNVPGLYLRRVPVRPMVPLVPYTAMHMVPTPTRRSVITPDRRMVRQRTTERRRPVQDVFLGDVTKDAPMKSQPPSAQKEYFDDGEDDRSTATEEEMREMESKRRAHSMIQGSICFNGEPAYKFKIFGGDDARAKFLKVCETTWDEYAARMP